MFLLIEPFKNKDLLDRPDLGCAMLISACKAKAIDIRLIETQVKYLKDILSWDVKESAKLLAEAINTVTLVKELEIGYSKKKFHDSNVKKIQEELKRLYNLMIGNKSYQNYLNSILINEFLQIFKNLMAVYEYFLVNNEFKPRFLKRMEKKIIDLNPSAVGFSIYTPEPFTKTLRKTIKGLGIPVIMGGAFTSQLDKQDIETLFREDYLDFLILHAGEKALPQLLNSFKSPENLKKIPNLVYKNKAKLLFKEIQIIENLNQLPNPDFSQFSLTEYPVPEIVLPLQTARGCTWKNCQFCAHHKSYLNNYAAYSKEKLLEIIKEYKNKYKVRHIAFHDEEIPVKRFKFFSKLLIDNGLTDFRFYAYARLVAGFNREIFALMYQAGFRTISWGLESGSDKILKLMGKGTTTNTMKRVLKDASDQNIGNICWIIFGFPGENIEDVSKTLKFLHENSKNIDLLLISKFQFEKGSPIYEQMIRKEIFYQPEYDVDILIDELQLKEQLGSIQLTNKRYDFLAKTNLSRIIAFLMNSKLKHMKEEELHKLLLKKDYCYYYPMILGVVEKKPLSFRFCNRSKSLSLNILSKEKITLNDFLKDMISLADGSRPFSEIYSSIKKYNSFCPEILNSFLKKLIEQKAIVLFDEP
ncbi:MAG: B12-binding domain-containing radical SAM protein [Desulfobacteraceae bacterium]|nr:B12-binding domain-containing radical SAM protein [Desulfobacteraceae bacterium]